MGGWVDLRNVKCFVLCAPASFPPHWWIAAYLEKGKGAGTMNPNESSARVVTISYNEWSASQNLNLKPHEQTNEVHTPWKCHPWGRQLLYCASTFFSFFRIDIANTFLPATTSLLFRNTSKAGFFMLPTSSPSHLATAFTLDFSTHGTKRSTNRTFVWTWKLLWDAFGKEFNLLSLEPLRWRNTNQSHCMGETRCHVHHDQHSLTIWSWLLCLPGSNYVVQIRDIKNTIKLFQVNFEIQVAAHPSKSPRVLKHPHWGSSIILGINLSYLGESTCVDLNLPTGQKLRHQFIDVALFQGGTKHLHRHLPLCCVLCHFIPWHKGANFGVPKRSSAVELFTTKRWYQAQLCQCRHLTFFHLGSCLLIQLKQQWPWWHRLPASAGT